MVLGFVLGRLFLAFFFVPALYRRELVTVYGYLEHRFGGGARTVAAMLFLLGRVVASGVRLYAACVAFHVATGLDIRLSILALGAFGTVYTLAGGIRAVVWTDVLLGLTFMAGGLVSALYLAFETPGGLQGILGSPLFPQKSMIIHTGWSLADSSTLQAGLLGGFMLTLATHGTDQDIAQRVLTCRDSRDGRLSLFGSALMILPLMALFLAVGTLLFFFYQARPPTYKLPLDKNHLFPIFILNELPGGFRGLVMAGLLAASISSFTSVLNALASSAVADFYRPFRRWLGQDPSETHLLRVSRASTLLWGALLVGVAILFEGSSSNILELALQTLTYFYGALLGAFLLGIFTRRGSNLSVIAGMLISVPVVLLFQLRQYLASPASAPLGAQAILEKLTPSATQMLLRVVPDVAWPYWIILGTGAAMSIGILGSRGFVAR
jgi:SSS family transporter